MIETSRAEGGTSQDCHPVPKWPTLPSVLIPLLGNGSREYGGGCVYLDISTWRSHICCPHPCLPHTSRAAWSQISGQRPGPGLPALVLLSSPVTLWWAEEQPAVPVGGSGWRTPSGGSSWEQRSPHGLTACSHRAGWKSCQDGAGAQERSPPPAQHRRKMQPSALLQTVAISCLQNTWPARFRCG